MKSSGQLLRFILTPKKFHKYSSTLVIYASCQIFIFKHYTINRDCAYTNTKTIDSNCFALCSTISYTIIMDLGILIEFNSLAM